MELTLKRTKKLEEKTIGELYIDGVKFCDTLEDKSRFTWSGNSLLGTKIFGKTAIPTGKYQVVMAYSSRFKKSLPLLLNVPQYVGILIHGGNTEADTEGCILVGKLDPKKNVIYGAKTLGILSKLIEKIEPTTKKGKVYITIVDNFK